MTTIAYDGVSVATDSYVTEGDLVVDFNYPKLITQKGVKFFLCGELDGFNNLVAKYFNPSANLSGDASAIVIHGKDVFLVELGPDKFTCSKAVVPMALGTGTALALGAMDAGASAREALKIAIKRDVYSGGRITCRKVRLN